MNEYEISIDIEPKNKYEKAEKDLIQALNSFQKLNFQEQQRLASKIFGAAQVDFVIRIAHQYNMKGD